MNWRVVRVVACVFAFVSFLLTPSFSQNYYVVVGAFSTDKDDVREFKSYLPGSQVDTFYTTYQQDGLMHFYVLKTSSKEQAVERSLTLQSALEGRNTSMGSKDSFRPETTIETPANLSEPEFGFTTASSKAAEGMIASGAGAPVKPKGKFFKFAVMSPEGSNVQAQVHHVDLEKGKELGAFNTNSYIDVSRPGKNSPMTVVCGVFGYKEIEKYIDFNNPSETDGAFQDENGAWVIPYALEPLERGDVSVMYNVAFYKDAVMMIPSSKGNLDDLVNMMKANPNYVIKVHAHANGMNARKIIVMGENSHYFDADNSNQKKAGPKELTNLRAEAIRSYLGEHGVDKERVKVYGWGASDMLVSAEDPHSRLNDRVEIEILRD